MTDEELIAEARRAGAMLSRSHFDLERHGAWLLKAAADRLEDRAAPQATEDVTEWGVRYGEGRVDVYGSSRNSERLARMDVDGCSAAGAELDVLVCRTVTYGTWKDVPRG